MSKFRDCLSNDLPKGRLKVDFKNCSNNSYFRNFIKNVWRNSNFSISGIYIKNCSFGSKKLIQDWTTFNFLELSTDGSETITRSYDNTFNSASYYHKIGIYNSNYINSHWYFASKNNISKIVYTKTNDTTEYSINYEKIGEETYHVFPIDDSFYYVYIYLDDTEYLSNGRVYHTLIMEVGGELSEDCEFNGFRDGKFITGGIAYLSISHEYSGADFNGKDWYIAMLRTPNFENTSVSYNNINISFVTTKERYHDYIESWNTDNQQYTCNSLNTTTVITPSQNELLECSYKFYDTQEIGYDWDSKASPYKIANCTWFNKNPNNIECKAILLYDNIPSDLERQTIRRYLNANY